MHYTNLFIHKSWTLTQSRCREIALNTYICFEPIRKLHKTDSFSTGGNVRLSEKSRNTDLVPNDNNRCTQSHGTQAPCPIPVHARSRTCVSRRELPAPPPRCTRHVVMSAAISVGSKTAWTADRSGCDNYDVILIVVLAIVTASRRN